MGTLVCFHAHPDDESISTGGTLARASAEGHRVVVVIATNGEYGEVPDDLDDGETLADRRRAETARSAAALGVDRIEWLGYKDSGMTGWEQNSDPESFLQADVDEAAERLAKILVDENPDVLTVYDWHGNYGHPDHIKVHTVGYRAADIAGTPKVLEATMNREHIVRLIEMARASGAPISEDDDFDPNGGADDGNPFGTAEAEITYAVDVTKYIAAKRESLRAHRSQITDTSFFLEMPDEAFTAAFGTEWFIEKTAEPGLRPGWLFE
ncbi:MAG TPA: PIG-L family deacetylase [Ilumatobacteraceae bacterium]|jgi:LmbE family N-acetylglucosaminyl deacetylase